MMFFMISRYSVAAFGLITIILLKSGGILLSFTKLDYSDGFKVSFGFVTSFLSLAQISGVIMFSFFDYLHFFSLLLILILFIEMTFMIAYYKKHGLYGN